MKNCFLILCFQYNEDTHSNLFVFSELTLISTPHLNLYYKYISGTLSLNNLFHGMSRQERVWECKGSNFSLNIKIFLCKKMKNST